MHAQVILPGVTLVCKVVITLSPEDWGLYEYLPLCGRFVNDLNQTLEKSFNNGASKVEAQQQALQLMQVSREYGAMEEGPQHVLKTLLDKLYALDEYNYLSRM